MRNKIWVSLVNYYSKASIMDNMVTRYQKYDKRVNMILAITSSGFIAAWSIWNFIPKIWATIVAIAQVIQTIKPYVPYSKYIRTLNEKSKSLHEINQKFERLFYDYDNTNIKEDVSASRYFELKKKAENLCFFEDDMDFIPKNTDIEKATKETALYLKTEYNVELKK